MADDDDGRDIFETALDNPLATAGAIGGAILLGRKGAKVGRRLGWKSSTSFNSREYRKWASTPAAKAYAKRADARVKELENFNGSTEDYYKTRSRLQNEDSADLKASGFTSLKKPNYGQRAAAGSGLGATVGTGIGAVAGGAVGAQADNYDFTPRRKKQ